MVAATMLCLGARVQAVFESNAERIGEAVSDVYVTADTGRSDLPLHIAIGSNSVRRRIDGARPGATWRALVHPDARLAPGVEIGDGSLICLGALVQTGARIGRHVIVNTGAIVEHDSWIGDFAHVAPGAVVCGDVRIGEGAMIGAGSVILPGIHVGTDAVVGAGAVVTQPVGAGETVIGVPARAASRP